MNRLRENLNHLEADFIWIKNIDNLDFTCVEEGYKNVICGYRDTIYKLREIENLCVEDKN